MFDRSGGLKLWLMVAAGVTLAWLVWPTAAQTDATRVVDPTTGEFALIRDLFNTSPTINSIILALSILAVLLFVYFMLAIRTAGLAPASLVDDLTKLVLAGKYEEAAGICRSQRNVFVATVIQRCLENTGKQHSVIMDMLDSEGRRRADILWNRISYLADIANVSPMLGLLGTVIGMIHAFFLIPRESMSMSSVALSESIGQAMSTTMFGLAVAICALVFYSIVKARTTRTLAEVEQVVHSLADHIKRGHQ